MKKENKYQIKLLGYFFALLLLIPAIGAKAEPGLNSAGLMVGQIWPSGEIGKDVDSAVAPGLFYEYEASDVFSLYTSAVKSTHTDGNLKLLTTSLGMKAHLVYLDKLSPYAIVGAGLYFAKKHIAATDEEAQKTLFGLQVGLGMDLDLSDRVFMGLEFDIHNLFAGHVTLPKNGKTEVSGRWAGFFLHAGLHF